MPDAPVPGRSPAQSLGQLRDLADDFAGTTQDDKGQKWELRLLPKPLYRYASTDPEIIDGAVFSFVSSAGTDPEAILVLEARKGAGTASPTWYYGVGRYTDLALRMRLKDQEILSVPMLFGSNPEDRYHILENRVIPAVENKASPTVKLPQP